MAREPNLTVRLEARIRDFERQMERATRTADRQFTQIETRASAMSGRMAGIGRAAFAPFAAGALAALAPIAAFNRALSTIADASSLAKAADRVGLTTKAFQELQFGMSLAGVEAGTFESGMEQFTKRIGDAATKGGALAEILKANGVAIRDSNGQIRTSESLLRDYANLIRNAGSEQEQLVLATEAFGRNAGASFVTALKNGASSLDDMAQATKDAGGTIDDELLRRAEILDDRFAALWRNFATNSKSAILTAATMIDDIITKFRELDRVQAAAQAGARVGAMAGNPIDPNARRRRIGLGPDARVSDAFRGDEPQTDLEIERLLRQRYGGNTVVPGSRQSTERGGSGRGNSGRDAAAAAALREAEAVLKVIENLQHERAQVGLTDAQRAKANALRQAGAAATTEQAAEIVTLIDAIYAERDALEAANEAMEEMRDIGRNVLGGLIQDLTSGTKAANALANAMRSIGGRLIDSGLNSLFSSIKIPGFAGGGYTGDGGKYDVAGAVHKGEYVFDKEATARIGVRNLEQLRKGFANGGYADLPSLPRMQSRSNQSAPSFTYAPTIDARGADSAAVAKLEQVIANDRRQFEARVTATVRKAQAGRQL